jgi:hypothetical protein
MAASRFAPLAGCAALLFASSAALAADLGTAKGAVAPLPDVAATRPAVDGLNGAFALFGGNSDTGGLFGAMGSIALPLGARYGAQTDGAVASLDGDLYLSIGQHLFWRDPGKGLVGLFGSYEHYAAAGGANAGRVAAEAEAYFDRVTLRGAAGVEFGSKGAQTTATTLTAFDLKTRFFDAVDVVYYPTDNLSLYLGHRFTGGAHALALGGEYQFASTGTMAFSTFAEGRVADDESAVYGGVKVRFGSSAKTMIRRDREDDPRNWSPDILPGIAGSLGTTVTRGYDY